MNLALWGAVFLFVVNLSGSGDAIRPVPTLVVAGILIVWLLLLRFALMVKPAE